MNSKIQLTSALLLVCIGASLVHAEMKALDMLRGSAKSGDPGSQYALGKRYYDGRGVSQDYEAAARWLHLAARQGTVDAQYLLGVMFDNGQGVTQDSKRAIVWWKRAARECREAHTGSVPQSYARCASYEHGSSDAQFRIGEMHSKGNGVPRDQKEAAKWWRMAAEQGHPGAQFVLGHMYTTEDYLDKDTQAAYTWFYLAESWGDSEAKERRQSLERQLTSKEVTEARRQILERINENGAIAEESLETSLRALVGDNRIELTRNSGGVFEVPVILNDVLKINMILDSGASVVSISPDVALTLFRTGTIDKNDWIGKETYQFADGSTARSTTFNLKSLQIGNYSVKNVKCSIATSMAAPMLLGQSALSKLGSYALDSERGLLILK